MLHISKGVRTEANGKYCLEGEADRGALRHRSLNAALHALAGLP